VNLSPGVLQVVKADGKGQHRKSIKIFNIHKIEKLKEDNGEIWFKKY
jgi:hypothetical protein